VKRVGLTPSYYFDDSEDPPELNPRILTTTDYDELLRPLGLGKDISFVQALVQLKVTKTISTGGFYAQRWPEYLEEKMGLKPLNDQNIPGSTWSRMLKSYQKGTDIRP
jgi:hypothetical protein